MNKEMLSAEIRNWFADLAIGAKAQTKSIQWGELSWHKARTYSDSVVDGEVTVAVHDLEHLAEIAELEVYHRDFTPSDLHYTGFRGENFVWFNDVKFTNYTGIVVDMEERRAREKEVKKWRKNNERQ